MCNESEAVAPDKNETGPGYKTTRPCCDEYDASVSQLLALGEKDDLGWFHYHFDPGLDVELLRRQTLPLPVPIRYQTLWGA